MRAGAIVPVDFAGRSSDMTALMYLAIRHQLKVIEGCAHAVKTHASENSGAIFRLLQLLRYQNVTKRGRDDSCAP
jgi:dTDP-4-amino-4,6-dideoxygalactose transaminase